MKKIYLIFFIFIFSNFSYANINIVYLDVQYVIDNSNIGKFYKEQLSKSNEKEKLSLLVQENLIKDKDALIKNQKNIIKEEELKKKINELNNLVNKYQKDRSKYNQNLITDKKKYTSKILEILNPLITNYVKKNNINLVIEKKNILVGSKTLDITNDILEEINKKTEDNYSKNDN